MSNAIFQEGSGLFRVNGAIIPLEGVEVYADIAGRAAKVRIRQRFCNAEKQPIEAVYKFPLPENAALCGFCAIIDDRTIKGRIAERERAFEIYDNALSKGHGAQLLDEERPNIFTLSVGNIKPGSAVVIEIDYVTLMDTEGPEVRFYLPTTISPRYTPDHQQDQDGIPVTDIVNPPFAASVPYGMKLNIDVHDIKGIASIGSPSHPINTEFSAGKAVVSFASETAAMDRDFILTISYKHGFSTRGLVFEGPDANYFQIDFTPEEQSACGNGNGPAVNREIIFVLDCSGSMDGSSIAGAKKALEIMIKALNSGTLFNIYRFGSQYEHLFSQSKAYDEKRMKEALKYLLAIDADLGGTHMLAPLKKIYSDPLPDKQLRDIVLITDGEISDEALIMDLARRHADRTALYTVGIGNGPNEFLIKGLARVSGGASALISPNERIEPNILRLFKKVIDGPVRNIRIAWDRNIDQAPRDFVAFFDQTTSIFARSAAGGGANTKVRITAETKSGAMSWDVPLEPVHKDVPIPALWAREKIREIEKGRTVAAGPMKQEIRQIKIREAIIAISKKYGIASSETSYIGIEKRSAADQTKAEMALRKVPVMLTEGWGGLLDSRARKDVPLFSRAMDSSVHKSPMAQYYKLMLDGTVDFSIRGIFPMLSGTVCKDFMQKLISYYPELFKGAPTLPTGEMEKDFLLELLSGQQASGGFAVADSLLKKMGLAELPDMAETVTIKKKGDKEKIFMTLLTLLVLEMRFQARRAEWETVVQKSRIWLQAEIERTQPTIDNQPLEQWLRDYLATHPGLRQLA